VSSRSRRVDQGYASPFTRLYAMYSFGVDIAITVATEVS
jgi:hypothetical protein